MLLVGLLVHLVDISKGNEFNNYVEFAVNVLKRTLVDPYHGVRKEACRLVVSLGQWNAKALGLFGDVIVKSILSCLGHRHSLVRISGLGVLRYRASKASVYLYKRF